MPPRLVWAAAAAASEDTTRTAAISRTIIGASVRVMKMCYESLVYIFFLFPCEGVGAVRMFRDEERTSLLGSMDRLRVGVSVLALIVSAGRIAAQEATTGAARPSPPATGVTRRPTLFLIGDSTVRNGRGDGANGQWGWGEPLAALFDASKIAVVNRALGGRSSRTYLTGGQWEAVKADLRPGDFVLMQFGHNDGGPINDTSRARGSLRGTGEETEEIDNLLTHEHEVVHTYG